MAMADPPDLPLSPTIRGVSTEEAQVSDRVTMSGLGSTGISTPTKDVDTKDVDTKKSDQEQILPIKPKGSWVGAVQGRKVLKKYDVEIEMKDEVGSITKDVALLWDDFSDWQISG